MYILATTNCVRRWIGQTLLLHCYFCVGCKSYFYLSKNYGTNIWKLKTHQAQQTQSQFQKQKLNRLFSSVNAHKEKYAEKIENSWKCRTAFKIFICHSTNTNKKYIKNVVQKKNQKQVGFNYFQLWFWFIHVSWQFNLILIYKNLVSKWKLQEIFQVVGITISRLAQYKNWFFLLFRGISYTFKQGINPPAPFLLAFCTQDLEQIPKQ